MARTFIEMCMVKCFPRRVKCKEELIRFHKDNNDDGDKLTNKDGCDGVYCMGIESRWILNYSQRIS